MSNNGRYSGLLRQITDAKLQPAISAVAVAVR